MLLLETKKIWNVTYGFTIVLHYFGLIDHDLLFYIKFAVYIFIYLKLLYLFGLLNGLLSH